MVGLIIAAGKQRRFKSDLPKALCEINGQPLAKRNYNLLTDVCDKVYVVVSDQNYDMFREYFEEDQLLNIKVAGLGSGDAIMRALRYLGDERVILCWGDVILTRDLVFKTLESYFKDMVGIPVVFEKEPYVQFKNDKVLFSKYGDEVSSGYHDLSIFIGDVDSLFKSCNKFYNKFFKEDHYEHKHGDEFEFLDIFNDTDILYTLTELKNYKDYSFNTVEEYEAVRNKLKEEDR